MFNLCEKIGNYFWNNPILRRKLTGEARRCIIGNYYKSSEDFIPKLKTIFAPSEIVYQLQEDLSSIPKSN